MGGWPAGDAGRRDLLLRKSDRSITRSTPTTTSTSFPSKRRAIATSPSTFDEKNNQRAAADPRPVPDRAEALVGGQGRMGQGARHLASTTLEPVMGSDPYKIAFFSPGSTIRYELRDDYWGKDLNVNVGQNNFGRHRLFLFRRPQRRVRGVPRRQCGLLVRKSGKPLGDGLRLSRRQRRTGEARGDRQPAIAPPASCRPWCRTCASEDVPGRAGSRGSELRLRFRGTEQDGLL